MLDENVFVKYKNLLLLLLLVHNIYFENLALLCPIIINEEVEEVRFHINLKEII